MSPARPRASKVLLLGEVAVGKTSLANRLAFGRFASDYKATIGVNLFTHDFEDEGAPRRFVLWDTDGEMGDAIFETAYVRGAAGALILCDASRPATWESMTALMEGFEEAMPGRPCIGVINKTDLIDSAPQWEAMPGEIVRASARSGAGVAEACIRMSRAIARRGL